MATDQIYEMVTNKVIAALEAGTVPWHKGWITTGNDMPRSMASGKLYRGINVFLLGLEGQASPWWGTYEQIAKLGGQVRKGEKGTVVVFWKQIIVKDKDFPNDRKKDKRIPLLRYFRVFNASQADGLPEKYQPQVVTGNEHDPIAVAEKIVAEYLESGPKLVNSDTNRAFYRPSEDLINIPPLNNFGKPEEYYSTLYHEIGHSTGHSSRLNREGIIEGHYFGSELYSKEELVAEMTAAMLSAVAGIDQTVTNNSAAYIASWLKKLRGDPKLVVAAAAQAQRAADLARSISFDVEEES